MLADFDLNKKNDFKILPMASFELQGKYLCGAGAALENNFMSSVLYWWPITIIIWMSRQDFLYNGEKLDFIIIIDSI